jgi:RND family efflux transporter MFP subunit
MAAAACGGGADEDAGGSPEIRVGTAVATLQSVPQLVAAIGTVAPRPGHYAALGAPAASRVARIFVAPGDRVAAGAPLVELERAPFEAAARSAEAALAAAQHAYDRAVRLARDGILPQKDVDQAASDLASARVTAVTAQRAEELATLRAPLAGVVTRMTAVLGTWVEASQLLVEVADPAALDVVVQVSPAEAARVASGAAVAVEAGERGGAGEPLGTGVVTGVGAEVDSASRTVAVRARLEHPVRPLRIGETVLARITVGVHAAAVTIPAEAVVPDGEGYRIFVVGTDGRAHARSVTLGQRGDSLVEVTSGLAAGETVVTHGAYGVEDSAKVVRQP